MEDEVKSIDVPAQERRSGRGASQIRTLRCEAGVLSRADGSAKWTQGSTEILVGVYGPRQGAAFLEDAEKATIAVTFQPKSGFSGPREKLLESFLKQTIEGAVILTLHPRTIISVTVQELSDDGGSLAVALNAANAALADAGVPMRYTFGAATCSKSPQHELLVDPDTEEEKEALAIVTACFAFPSKLQSGASSPGILSTQASGSAMTVEDFVQLKNLCQRVSEKAAALFKQSMAAAFR